MGTISSIYNSGNEIKKFYLGSQELKVAYLGDLLVYNGIAEDLNSRTLAKYTFDNTIGDCLPTFTGITTDDYSVSDTVDGRITTRTICSDLDELPTITRIRFRKKHSLLTVDYLRVDSNITSMDFMFSDCINLTSINTEGWNTSNVTDMSYLFQSCNSLVTLDASSFNTQNVKDMIYMFYGCSSLTSLDLSNFNTQNVKYMSNMFGNWTSNQTVYIGKNWTIDVSSYKAKFIRLETYLLDTENRNKSVSRG